MEFSHENLDVYKRSLVFSAAVAVWVDAWDSKHAICDQLSRASGSILENIAVASASHTSIKIRSLDYSIGSTLECAACLDLAGIKRLLDPLMVTSQKQDLVITLKMLIALRKSWASKVVREDSPEYVYSPKQMEGDKAYDKAGAVIFHHERLDVYQVALEVARKIVVVDTQYDLSITTFRRLDVLVTSMVLNIAEGNGRFSVLDQSRFVGASHEAAIKLASRLDLCGAQNTLPLCEVDEIKELLSRVAAMTAAIIGRSKSR